MKRFDQINMIPFIDVMLVLLAIVLTTATFVSKGLIDVDIPTSEQAQATTNQDQKEPVYISVDINNELYIDEEAVAFASLGDSLAAYEVDQPFIIRMDKKTDFEHFVTVIDALKKGSFNKLSIQANKDQ